MSMMRPPPSPSPLGPCTSNRLAVGVWCIQTGGGGEEGKGPTYTPVAAAVLCVARQRQGGERGREAHSHVPDRKKRGGGEGLAVGTHT